MIKRAHSFKPLKTATLAARSKPEGLVRIIKKQTNASHLLCVLLCAFILPSTSYAQDITTGLVGHWRLDETTGTTALDNSGNGLDMTMAGSLTGTSGTTQGRVKTALQFNGTSNYARVDSFDLDLGSNFSMAFWLKRNNNNGTSGIHFFDIRENVVSRSVIAFRGANNDIQYRDTTGTPQGAISMAYPTDGKWHHYSLTYDGSNLTAYKDGVIESTTPASITLDDINEISLSACCGLTGANFEGTIDDVRVYNRALTSEDITELYRSASGNMIFNTENDTLQYFDDKEWIAAGPPKYKPNAVNFDGTSTRLDLGSPLSGVSNTKLLTFSAWMKVDDITTNYAIFDASNSASFSIGSSGAFRVRLQSSVPSNLYFSTHGSGYDDDEWHHFLFSIDLGNNIAHAYIDDVPISIGTVNDGLIDFVGAASSSIGDNANLSANLSDLWLDAGTYIDLSIEENRRAFIDAAGNPVDLGDDGSKPTGAAPDIFLSGDTDDWHTNKGTGGGFTENGTLSTAGLQISNPQSISGTSFDLTPSLGHNVITHGSYMYYFTNAASGGAMYVVNISDPTNPTLATTFSDPIIDDTSSMRSALVYPYIYIANHSIGTVDIIDISNPTSPVIRGSVSHALSGARSAYATDDGYFFVLSNPFIDSFDMRDPDNPIHLNRLGRQDCAGVCTIMGEDRIYMNDSSSNLDIIDISDPSNMTISQDVLSGLPFFTRNGIINGNHMAFYDSSSTTFFIFDISNPDSPIQVSEYNSSRNYLRLYIQGDMFIGFVPNTYYLYRFKNGSFTELANGAADRFASFATIKGRYAYGVKSCCAPDTNDVFILDLATCTAPSAMPGSIIYESANDQMQYCDGVNWVPMGPAGDGGAGCSSPSGDAGDLTYNTTYNVMQYCEGDAWVPIGRSADPCDATLSPAIGQTCRDGSIYAGLSPDGNVSMFTTPANAQGTFTWNDGNTNYVTTGATNANDGDGNTATIIAADSNSVDPGIQQHNAAQYCYDLSAHGYTDWYLPDSGESGVLGGMIVATYGNPASRQELWTSQELSQNNAFLRYINTDGSLGIGNNAKSQNWSVRCVRKD